MPAEKKGNELSECTIALIKSFYEDDEYSKLMPGQKDCVSIARNKHQQKCLLLTNLSFLYSQFKKRYPKIMIGFSKFCTLWPKWCVLASSSGSH